MAKSTFYDATEEDSRPWVATHTAEAKDSAAVANAATIQSDTRDTNPVDGIVATPATTTLGSTTGTVQIVVTPQANSTDTTSGVAVTYESSATAKATVSDTGLVTGVEAGTATITVTAVHDTSLTDTVVVTVP